MKSPELQKKSRTEQGRQRSRLTLKLRSLNISKERDYFFDDLSMMLKSGVSVSSALELIIKGTRQKRYKTALNEIYTKVNEGKPLWKALEAAHIFGEYAISLVRAGEESGQLAENMDLLAKNEEKQRIFRAKIRNAVSYPIFVLGLTVAIGIGAVLFIFPRLSTVFTSLNIKLPTITKVVIGFGETMQQHGVIIVGAGLAILAVLIFFLFIFKPTKKVGEGLLLKTPGIGKLIKQVEVQKFGYLLGTLMEAGIPINQALASVESATKNTIYLKLYTALRNDIELGISAENSLLKQKRLYHLIPRPVVEMIATGEKSGRLPDVLIEIGDRYEKKSNLASDNLGQMLEPVLLVLVWLGVLGIALSVIVPIYGLVGGLNGEVSNPTPQSSITSSTNSGVLTVVNAKNGVVSAYLKPNSSSNVVLNVKADTEYSFSDFKNNFYKISITNSQTGWLPAANAKVK